MSLQQKIKNTLHQYGIHPNKRLGQNFIIDAAVIEKMLDVAQVDDEDTVVEVGPGSGTITEVLAQRAQSVIAVEKDPQMIKLLHKELERYKNVEIIEGDILKFEPADHEPTFNEYKLVGAPPYYLTARLFRHFLQDAGQRPSLIAVIIQREVAQKIIADPPKSNLLAISVRLYGTPAIQKIIPKGSFWPVPEVDSALLTVTNITEPSVDEKSFFRIVRAGFSSPRKQLLNNLSAGLGISRENTAHWLKNSGLKPTQRAQELSLQQWLQLVKSVDNFI